MIVHTLPVFYYEKLVGYTPSSFADLVFTGERIEVGLRRGKFDYPALMNRKPGANGESMNEGGTHVVTVIPTWPNSPPAPTISILGQYHLPAAHPIPNTTLNTNQNTNQGRNFPENKPAEFTPIPMPYADLLPYMLDNAMAVINPARTPQPSFPR
ncbi:hypothetical protein GmHk_20G057745 [Glycine max]|nr:hypothetical protein GmHk_20G057745 [Glycine max]